jgi:hypothetical protein
LTFSYDDGQVFDRRLVDILNKHGLRGSFHLNSGRLGEPGFVTMEEVSELYKGHEISVHGVQHLWLTQVPDDVAVQEIWEDRRALEALAGYPVRGMSYAFGDCSRETTQKLKGLGIEYARTVASTNSFKAPPDFLEWNPTCHHSANLQELAEKFLGLQDYMGLSVFYVWGHSFEFDREDNWEIIENFASMFAGMDNIWRATNIEICRYVKAARSLVSSVDGKMLHNPSGIAIWLKFPSELKCIQPGGDLLV